MITDIFTEEISFSSSLCEALPVFRHSCAWGLCETPQQTSLSWELGELRGEKCVLARNDVYCVVMWLHHRRGVCRASRNSEITDTTLQYSTSPSNGTHAVP